MARIQHVAIAVPDPDAAASFYERALGLKRIGETHSSIADGVFLTDGFLNLAFLKYRTDEAAGPGRDRGFVGTHHFGVRVDDLDESESRILENGGSFLFGLPKDRETLDFELKFVDPHGVIFDISKKGWRTSS